MKEKALQDDIRDSLPQWPDLVEDLDGKIPRSPVAQAKRQNNRMPKEEVERLLVPVLARANEAVAAYAKLSLDMVKIFPVEHFIHGQTREPSFEPHSIRLLRNLRDLAEG